MHLKQIQNMQVQETVTLANFFTTKKLFAQEAVFLDLLEQFKDEYLPLFIFHLSLVTGKKEIEQLKDQMLLILSATLLDKLKAAILTLDRMKKDGKNRPIDSP